MKFVFASMVSVTSIAAAACAGGGSLASTSDGGADREPQEQAARPQAIASARLEQTEATTCDEVGDLFQLGTFGSPPSTPASPVPDGQPLTVGVATVRCTVKPTGEDTFDVTATLAISGLIGKLTIEGRLGATGDQPGVKTLLSKGGHVYEQPDCVFRFPDTFHGIAAGRLWGELTCPAAVKTSPSPDAAAPIACMGVAELRLENCEQH